MNALFLTQGSGLRLHARVCEALRQELGLQRTGFYVCDSMHYREFLLDHPAFAAAHTVVSEWDIVAAARRTPADVARLRELEDALTEPLFHALLCDRRVMLGRWCKERQDYRPRYDHDGMMRLLDAARAALIPLFDEVRPDIVFSFVPVTFGEYFAHLLAAQRGIPVLSLYPTKVRNYMMWMESIFGRPPHLVDAYHRRRAPGLDAVLQEAERYVAEVTGRAVRHEGMIPIPGTVATVPRSSPLASLRRHIAGEVVYRTTESRHDPHVDSVLLRAWHREVMSPLRRRAVLARLRPHVAPLEVLRREEFCFFPLQAEPEIALSIQGRPFLNQIELVRNIARSLPIGMFVVVKEHPRSIGYRPFGYYRKLLEIPNVRIASPFVEARELIAASRLVATVWSFTGFEAVVNQRPVLLFGTPSYGLLPQTMVRQVTDVREVPGTVRSLLAEYAYDEAAVVAFVAANIESAVPLDFYSRYLRKRGRYGESADSSDTQFDRFIAYTADRAREVTVSRFPADRTRRSAAL